MLSEWLLTILKVDIKVTFSSGSIDILMNKTCIEMYRNAIKHVSKYDEIKPKVD